MTARNYVFSPSASADIDYKVGPIDTPNGTTYVYRIGDQLSANGYANPASARHDARRPQRTVADNRLEPVDHDWYNEPTLDANYIP